MTCALRIGLFFDGTGQGRGGNSESNIAKLYELYEGSSSGEKHEIRQRKTLVFKHYITGVGTTEGFIDRKIAKGYGGGVGKKIYDTIDYVTKILDSHPYGTDEKRYKLREIDVFGFSRGAAEARGFVNTFTREYVNRFPKYNDVRFNFIGLFDTVAAIGKADNNINMIPKKENAQAGWIDMINSGLDPLYSIVPASEDSGLGDEHTNDSRYQPLNLDLSSSSARRIVHMTAHDEKRINFPLVDTYGAGAVEYELIGVHSDIGGGYEPFKNENFTLNQPYNTKEQALNAAEKEASSRNAQMGAYGASGYGGYTPDEEEKSLFSQFPTPHSETKYIPTLHKHTPNTLSIVSLHLMYDEAKKDYVPLKKPSKEIPNYLKHYYEYAKVAKQKAWTYEANEDGDDLKRALTHHSAVGEDGYIGDRGIGDVLFHDSSDGIGGNDINHRGRAIFKNNSAHAVSAH